jgi:hypothetical protein
MFYLGRFDLAVVRNVSHRIVVLYRAGGGVRADAPGERSAAALIYTNASRRRCCAGSGTTTATQDCQAPDRDGAADAQVDSGT